MGCWNGPRRCKEPLHPPYQGVVCAVVCDEHRHSVRAEACRSPQDGNVAPLTRPRGPSSVQVADVWSAQGEALRLLQALHSLLQRRSDPS